MSCTTPIPTCPKVAGTDRRKQKDQSNKKGKKIPCMACNEHFTEWRSLLRHWRENRRNCTAPTRSQDVFICGLCQKNFVRQHDLKRHYREQHRDGKVPCPRCGKTIRPRSTHKNSNGLECPQYKDGSARPSVHLATSSNHDISQFTGQDESHQSTTQEESQTNAVLEAMLQSLKEYLMPDSSECSSAYAEACRKQVRLATYREKIPCGICRTEFEVLDNQALYRHLELHFIRLRGKHRCEICMINFVHDDDLQRHITSAQKGDCGFSFPHTAACGGHHPPTSGNCNDRTSFEITVSHWELKQLGAYIFSIERLAIAAIFSSSSSSTNTTRSY